jgi:hypothetical protein
VAVVTQGNNSVTITIHLSHIYVDLDGQVVFFLTRPLEGFVLLEGVQVTLTAPLLDAGGGMKTMGPSGPASVTTTNSQVQVHSNTTGFDSFIGALSNVIFSQALSTITSKIPDLVNPILSSVPPFTL